MSSIVNTQSMSVGYGKKVVIDNINLEFSKGTITSLIGPNGSGKSTVLKTILGQIGVLDGCVFIDGQDIKKINGSRLAKKMAMVMTRRPKTELMTCFEVAATGRYPYTGHFGTLSDEDVEKVNNALEFVGAIELGERDFSCISDGQKQRIMIARAIAQEPEILILDEPTSFLDIRYKLDILSAIRRLAKERSVTIIMSLHELELAKGISDFVIAVEDGHIGRTGKPEEIFKDGYIQKIYNIDVDCFDENTGMLIMPEWV